MVWYDNSNKYIFTGGAGVGKSFMINVLAKYVEKILRCPGDDPSKPKIILLGPTGMAASLIGKSIFLD